MSNANNRLFTRVEYLTGCDFIFSSFFFNVRRKKTLFDGLTTVTVTDVIVWDAAVMTALL